MRKKGKLTTWHDDKGFGFVTPFDGSKQVFVHIKAFSNRTRRPETNDVVTFSLSNDKQGRPCAANAVLAGDKSWAKMGAWRTAEGTLHLLGLAGGWPGALIAQQTLRHKSKKVSFVSVLWATVLINGGVFLWLHTEGGQAALQALLA